MPTTIVLHKHFSLSWATPKGKVDFSRRFMSRNCPPSPQKEELQKTLSDATILRPPHFSQQLLCPPDTLYFFSKGVYKERRREKRRRGRWHRSKADGEGPLFTSFVNKEERSCCKKSRSCLPSCGPLAGLRFYKGDLG